MTNPDPATATAAAAAPRLRTSDAERKRVTTIIGTSVKRGTLTAAEGDVRRAAVAAATYQDELDPIVADLPLGTRARRGPVGSATVRGALTQLGAAVLLLLGSLAALAGRNRIATAVVAVLVIGAIVALAVAGGEHGFGHGFGHGERSAFEGGRRH